MANPDEHPGQSAIIEICEADKTYQIELPYYKTDYIQKTLFKTKTPYEVYMLRDMAARLSPNDLVLDIGANIGNHTLYLAAVCECNVEAFEPNVPLGEALKRSVVLNGLESRVRVHLQGVGAKKGVARFADHFPENLGAQSLALGAGEIPVVTLDASFPKKTASAKIKSRKTKEQAAPSVRMIKMDVEGMELDVLRGARKLIARDRPILYIESAEEGAFRTIQSFLDEMGYIVWESFNATPTHLFLPSDSVSQAQFENYFKSRDVFAAFHQVENVLKLKAQLNETNLKYRSISEHLADARAKLAELQGKNAELAADLEKTRQKYRVATEQNAVGRNALKVTQTEAADLSASLEVRERRMIALEGVRSGFSARLDELSWELEQSRREHARNEARLQQERARAERAEAQIVELQSKIAKQDAQRHQEQVECYARGDFEGASTQGVAPALVAGWMAALPAAHETVAERWFGLAKNLMPIHPAQAKALLRVVCALPQHRLSIAAKRKLGFLLIEDGKASEALALLDTIVAEMNLSSREAHLLALARREGDGARLRKKATNAVRSKLRVAAIMDEFTALGYGPECDLQQLSVDNWREELEWFQPDLVLIESAWRGLNEEWGSKVGHISSEIQGILDWSSVHGIPKAFWNKEDPVHFETFLNLAQKFDYVFTTDVDCIPRYKASLVHDRVHFLPFACQPEIHNPIESEPRKRAFCFAGAYYVRYPDRTRDLDDFLAHLPKHLPFEIFDRNFGKDHPDYMFPEDYRKYIIGTLRPIEIDRAYKGYEFGINLNSVKSSQSMYARRVYELLASNTRVISNYSRGLRKMFGDLVISTDSGAEAVRRIVRQDTDNLAPRVRLAGLRKAMLEHTYSHRIARIAALANLDIPDPSALPTATMVGRASNRAEAEHLLTHFRRQRYAATAFVLVVPEEVDLAGLELPTGIRCVTPRESAGLSLMDLAGQDGWIAGLVPEDYYGPNYLTDMIMATRYSAARIIGKGAYHQLVDGEVKIVEGPSYCLADEVAMRRAILQVDLDSDQRVSIWLDDLAVGRLSGDVVLSVDAFNYCAEGADDPAGVAAWVDDLAGLNVGISESKLESVVDAWAPAQSDEIPADQMISGQALAANMTLPTKGALTFKVMENGDWMITSALGESEHKYIYETRERSLQEIAGPLGDYPIYAHVDVGLNMLVVVVWLDAGKEKIDHKFIGGRRNVTLTPPEGAEYVRFGIRARGPGACVFHGLQFSEHFLPPRPVVGQGRVLLLTNHYPSYDDLYRNGFVHSRVRAYREMGGITLDVYRLKPEQDLTWHEFQNIDCMTGSAEQLDFLLGQGGYTHVLVHFLDAGMWRVLERHIDRVPVTVWVHGAEVQPWWRRTFNFATDEELTKAKAVSAERMTFWRGVFNPLPKNLQFVFVSKYFAEEVFEDLEVTCPRDQYQIIHNPIDDALFAYHEKPLEQRGKILSIRPFASAKYANDLSVKAILSLKRRDFFDQLEFRIIGDGPLFDEITAPLKDFPNVTLEKRFLAQTEIAALHRHYGVFLNPTRMDAQGVSRDEAMSSGLVPVTSRNSAIPEFVDDTCGYMAESEDAEGLARAIVDLWKNPEVFAAKSRAAAARVRAQSGKTKVIEAELAVIGSPLESPSLKEL